MGKKSKKKANLKKLKYAKFHKEKSAALDLTMPDLDEGLQKQKRDDETRYMKYFRYSRNQRSHEIVKRRESSKRDVKGPG